MSLSFKEFLNEAVFKAEEFTKKISKKDKGGEESITYGKAVINKLVNGESVKLGKDGKAGEFDIRGLSDDLRGKLESLITNKNLESDPKSDVKRFDRIINGIDPDLDSNKNNTNNNPIGKKLPKNRWTNIFKGDFSGNPEGPSTKGHNFEKEFLGMIRDGIKIQEENGELSGPCKELIDVIGEGTVIKSADLCGTNNTKRPFNFDEDEGKMWIGNDSNKDEEIPNIGKDISDITLQTNNGPVYLSLKFGSTNSVLNLGVSELFPKEFFEGSKSLGKGAQALLECLCIDADQFKQTFVSYKDKKSKKDDKKKESEKTSFKDVEKENAKEKEVVDNKIGNFNNNKAFEKLILQAFGYGYILVHKSGRKGGEITYRDFRDKNAVEKYIKDKEGSNFKAKVEYGGKSGEGKRVQVEVNYADVLILNVVIRNTKSKIYPDKLQVMYKFAPERVVEN